MPVHPLPDQDHVVRHVPWAKLRRDGDDNVLGFLPAAFERRPDEESLSVNWLECECFLEPTTRVRDCIWAMRKARKAGGKSAFAIGNVGKIKATCLEQGQKVRIVHEPKDGEPAHAGIRRLPRDDLKLLAALAEDAFVEMVRNGDIADQPGD
jgi:hypothetical protein